MAAFALEDLLDPIKEATVWGTTANPDGDSLSNLEEYFHVTSPLSREEDPISSNTIEVGMVEYLEMVFPRRKNPAGVLQIIEEAAVPNTAGWGPATGILESTESVNTSTEEVRIRYPIGTLTRRFLRLRLDTN